MAICVSCYIPFQPPPPPPIHGPFALWRSAIVEPPKAWGEDIHIGRYDLLTKDELDNMDARQRIRRATTISTEILLGKAFPFANSEPLPSGFTVMDMGSAHGSTARAAAKEYGCNVSC